MRNIFKTFKDNKQLIEENKILKAKNEALENFKGTFDDFYHSITSTKYVDRVHYDRVVLQGAFNLDDEYSLHCPADICKKEISARIAEQLEPYIEFDIVDNRAYGTKVLVGKLSVMKGETK